MSDYSPTTSTTTTTTTGRDGCVYDEMDVSCAASSDVDSIDDDDDDDNDFNLWEHFVEFTSGMKKWSIFDTVCYFLSPYILRSEDDTYKEIMYDVELALQYQNMSYTDALDYALEKNKDSIFTSIDTALNDDCGDDDSFTIWCALAALRNKNKGCHWLSYSPCYCNECCGICMTIYLKYMLLMFHHMDTDDIIYDVMGSITRILQADDKVTLFDASEIAVQEHRNDIVEKVHEAEKGITDSIVSGKSGIHQDSWNGESSSADEK